MQTTVTEQQFKKKIYRHTHTYIACMSFHIYVFQGVLSIFSIDTCISIIYMYYYNINCTISYFNA